MDETKIEQVVATPEEAVEEVKAPEVAEEPTAETEEAPAMEEPTEAPATEVVAEGCDCNGESCKAKKEEEDDQSEKKVSVKEGLRNDHDARQRKEVAKEQSKDLMESMEDLAAEKVTDIVMEAIANLPIVEGMTEDEDNARKEEIMENGSKLLADVYSVLEEVVNGTTVELTGHQVEVKDFVQTGGKVAMGLPAGINPPTKHEDDESEKRVQIKAYHEGAEEIDYKAKYAESEANMDELVDMVQETADKYTKLVQEYNAVVEELQAYKISEAYSITVDDAADMLKDYSFDQVCEALDNYEQGLEMVSEGEEEKAEETEADTEEKKDKEEEKKEEKEEKAMEEIKESLELKEEVIISEDSQVSPRKNRAFSVFRSEISESEQPKRVRKAYSVFAD